MKFYIGVTDNNWFQYLVKLEPNELNFWQPGGKQTFKAIQANDLFLFLPVSLAWESFGNKNGTSDYLNFRNLWDKLPRLAKERTEISAIFVNGDKKLRKLDRWNLCATTINYSWLKTVVSF